MNNKKRRVKRKSFFASPYEIEAIEYFLEKEAENGWMFKKCSGMFYVFEECEPIKLRFQVDYFDQATVFDTNPESKTLDYIEYCRESGWHHLFSLGKMQIFYSAEENPVPIQTDENVKLKLASKATILEKWAAWIILPLIWGINIGLKMLGPRYYSSYSRCLTELSEVGMVIFWLAFTLLSIVSMVRFGTFYFRNIRRLKNGLHLHYYSSKNVKRFGVFNQIYLLGLLVFLGSIFTNDILSFRYFLMGYLGMIVMIFLVSKITYSKWANRKVNIVLTFVTPIVAFIILINIILFSTIGMEDAKVSSGNTTYYYSTDDIDITLNDLEVDKPDNFLYEETIHDKSKSFLAMSEEYSDYFFTDDNSYGYLIEIFSSKYKSIMDNYNKLVLEEGYYTFTELTATENAWYSDQVFYGKHVYASRYVVIEDGITFVITGDLNQAQAAELSSYYMKK